MKIGFNFPSPPPALLHFPDELMRQQSLFG